VREELVILQWVRKLSIVGTGEVNVPEGTLTNDDRRFSLPGKISLKVLIVCVFLYQ